MSFNTKPDCLAHAGANCGRNGGVGSCPSVIPIPRRGFDCKCSFENGADAFSCNRREEATAFRVARSALSCRRKCAEESRQRFEGQVAKQRRSRPHGPARGDPRGWRGRRRRGATPSGVEPRGDGDRAGRACATPRRPALSRGKDRTRRLSYRRFQCRAADSVLSVVENKEEQFRPQPESVVFKKSG